MRRHFWTYLALSTMAFAQPILDLYGRNVTVFSASKLSQLEVALFLGLVLLGPALAALGVDWLSRFFGPRVNESVRLLLLSGFSLVLGFAVARWLDVERNRYSFGLALVMAMALPWAFDRFKPVRQWSRALAVLALVVGGNAVFQLRPVLASNDGPTTTATMDRTDVSVLLVLFDEFPLYPLLSDDGTIDPDRFPGFAELAAGSTWYRNSVGASNFTHQAVPAVLASAEPKSVGGPFLYEYPRNIFTVYRGLTTVAGTEPVTSLCPASLCQADAESVFAFQRERFWSFLGDAAAVYGQRVLPRYLRRHLPDIDGQWGGFGAVRGRFREQFDKGALAPLDAVETAVSQLVADPSPRVQVVHSLVPHAPWRLLPDERVAPLSAEISTKNPEDADGVRDTYQAFLHQLGAVDAMVARVIGTLKDAGRWDDTLVVVTADHGISFMAGSPQRNTDFTDMSQATDVYRIPTFIKYPDQSTAKVDDCPVVGLDILPTIMEATGTTSPWEFAGRSVATSCPQRTRTVWSATGHDAVLDGGFEEVRERVQFYASMVPNEGPLTGVSAVGASAPLIGTPIGEVPQARGVSWTLAQKAEFTNVAPGRGARVPALVTGSVRTSERFEEGTEGVIAIDGVAAGVLGELGQFEWTGGPIRYTGILRYSLLTPGDHVVELYLRAPDGSISRVGPPR